jgi:hypothetical protein
VSVGSRLGSHLLEFAGFAGGFGPAPEQAGLLLLPEPVAVALDVDGGRVMEQAIQDGGGQDLIVEDLPPVDEALVAGDDEAGPLVAADQEPEKEAGLLPESAAGSRARRG